MEVQVATYESGKQLQRIRCIKCDVTFEHIKKFLAHIKSHQNFDIEFEDVKSENIKVEGVKNEGQIEGLKLSNESDVVNSEKPTESLTERNKHSSHEEPKETKLKKFDCDKCDKTYAHKRSLDTHKKRVHKKVKKNCRKSPKSISFPNVPRALRSHTRSQQQNEGKRPKKRAK